MVGPYFDKRRNRSKRNVPPTSVSVVIERQAAYLLLVARFGPHSSAVRVLESMHMRPSGVQHAQSPGSPKAECG